MMMAMEEEVDVVDEDPMAEIRQKRSINPSAVSEVIFLH